GDTGHRPPPPAHQSDRPPAAHPAAWPPAVETKPPATGPPDTSVRPASTSHPDRKSSSGEARRLWWVGRSRFRWPWDGPVTIRGELSVHILALFARHRDGETEVS